MLRDKQGMTCSFTQKLKVLSATAVFALAAFATSAQAGSYKDDPAPAPTGRQFSWSANIGATTDYVFRGYTQNNENPALQGGADMSYGIFYAGVWGSGIDFGPGTDTFAEVDLYAGIKPTWGPVTFDLGVIYYAYPGANDGGAELDYVELKFGASTTIQKFSFGGTVFYSPEYTGEVGETWTLEGTVGYELPSFRGITPTIGGTVGTVLFQEAGNTDYTYWNAGVAFVIDKLTIDLRYWDTDIDSVTCKNVCDERFVATVKVALP